MGTRSHLLSVNYRHPVKFSFQQLGQSTVDFPKDEKLKDRLKVLKFLNDLIFLFNIDI